MADTVSDLFSGIVTTKLQWQRIDAQEVGSVTNKKTAQTIYTLGDGTAAGAANLVYADTRTIAANGVDSINCFALTQQTLDVPVPFSFSQLRLVRIANEETGVGKFLYVGASPTDPFSVFAHAVGPASEMLAINQTDAWLVNASNATFYIANPSSTPATYSITLMGS
jgi:hypothetical protein